MASVTRKQQSTRTGRRDEMRDRLLIDVEQLIADGASYTELSVERLASIAGVSRSTFYVYFEDKSELLRAWFGEIIGQVGGAARRWWTLPGDATREDLHAALQHLVATYRPHALLMAAVVDASGYDPAVRAAVAEMMRGNTAGLRKHIREGQRAGSVDPDLRPAETASWLTWMAERGLHQLIRGASDPEVDRLVEAYTDIVWKTLYVGAPSRR